MTDGGSAFWVLVDEAPSDTCDKMSLVGIFRSADFAKAHLVDGLYIGSEEAARIVWTEHNPRMISGHNANHEHCYLLTLEDIRG